MAVFNVFIFVSLTTLILLTLGIHDFLTNFETNSCEMTYMYEYPQYVRISLPRNVTINYPKYGLYAYGEGQFTERIRHMRFDGTPVLFIPGNSGSMKQVRSLASVSLRKAIDKHVPFHFDFFSVDLNEEYSGLYGGVLKDQADFVHHCMLRILNLYDSVKFKPKSIILIGHSMGGIVARGLFLLPDFEPSHVNIIITLATPHQNAPIIFDRYTAKFYSAINKYWHLNRETKLRHISFISIGGGHRDILVRSGLTLASDANINVLTTAMPGVWVSTDHQCSMWCKQLVLVVVRALFDSVDLKTKQITENVSERNEIFRYHMIQRSAGKKYALALHPATVEFDQSGNWNEYLKRQITIFEPKGVNNVTHIMVRLLDDPKHERLAVSTGNIESRDWVFACNANSIRGYSRICDYGINLSNKSHIIPSESFSKMKMVYLNLANWRKKAFSHVILRIPRSTKPVQMNIDVHSSDRYISYNVPGWWEFFKKRTIIKETDANIIYNEINLLKFESVWQSFILYVEPLTCQRSKHHAVAYMWVPWNAETTHAVINEKSAKHFPLRLQVPKPSNYKGVKSVKIQLVLDPACTYSISIKSSLPMSLGQIVRFHLMSLIPYLVVVLVLTLRQQILSLSETGECMMFHSALCEGAKPYTILPASKITSRFLFWISGQSLAQNIPVLTEWFVSSYNGSEFILLPLIQYMIAVGLVYVFGLLCWVGIFFSGHTAHKIAVSFVAKVVTGAIVWSEWMLNGMAKLPSAVAALLIALSFSTCGGLSICIGAAFYFLKLCKIYEDHLEDLFKLSMGLLFGYFKKRRQDKDDRNDNITAITRAENDSVSQEESKAVTLSVTNKADLLTDSNLSSDNEDSDDFVKIDGNDQSEEQQNEVSVVEKPENVNKAEKEPESRRDSNRGSMLSFSELHINFTLFLLWVFAAALSVPSVLIWAHNYSYSNKLIPDPTFTTSITLCSCACILWQMKIPKPNLRYYRIIGNFLFGAAVFMLVCTPSIYILPPTIGSIFVLVTLHQLFAPTEQSFTISNS